MLNSLKILKRRCEATLNTFLKKKVFIDDDKKFYLHAKFLCQFKILQLNM